MSTSFREDVKDFVGCDVIIKRFEIYRLNGIDPELREFVPMALIFKGPPGTGKTMMAHKIGKLFCDIGLVSSSTVVECSISNITSKSLSSSVAKIRSLMDNAIGKVLLIHEAHRLAEEEFAEDAVDQFFDCIAKAQSANKTLVILAGYETGMNMLARVYPDLAVQFKTEIVFSHLRPEHCLILLQRSIANFGIQIGGLEETSLKGKIRSTHLRRMFADLAEMPSWANGRDIKKLAKSVAQRVFIVHDMDIIGTENLIIPGKEVEEVVYEMLKETRKNI